MTRQQSFRTGKDNEKKVDNENEIIREIPTNKKAQKKIPRKTSNVETVHFRKMKERAIDQQHLYVIKQSENKLTFTINKKDQTTYIVTFSESAVSCTCPAMAELEKETRISTKTTNQVCKH